MSKDMDTVYIIGAGASVDWGFPVGDNLKNDIARLLDANFDGFVDRGLSRRRESLLSRQEFQMADSLLERAGVIKAAMPLAYSIDNFLDAHKVNKELTKLGKLSIVRTILGYEEQSKLYTAEGRNIADVLMKPSWHRSLFQSLVENCDIEQFKERLTQVTFIIFNYDRVVEQFLLLATQLYYEVSETKAAEVINVLKIIHPYGQCGGLHWQSYSDSSEDVRDFGDVIALDNTSHDLFADQISTFTDKDGLNTDRRRDAHYAILGSNRIISLGFAFHPMNMKWLNSISLYFDLRKTHDYMNDLSSERKVFTSAMGVSQSDLSIIEESCKKAFGMINNKDQSRFHYSGKDADCGTFMKEFSLSIGYGELIR